ncbi:Rpn family recombination-promoting nuclease/putative transposase [Priestia megaterium]|uniref:Rpn family recombination-promoting nuclease/putative transposase n=1 Tax=Priestia megaterium TaxID=1404 RepID=UPI00203DD2C2|nr:Rpn family recombination-promoting nuclease/putative transposase [Priestia megaterium]MCM3185925.1 Rpn family recombination-promoting nuclease/putative transposase [Priestia megaterium]
MTKRLDLRVDFAFKSLFGTHGNESILAAFLNAALRFPDDKKIQTVQLLDPHFNKENQEDKRSILDVHAQLEDGTRVNIEIQLNNKHDMEKRTLYYWSKMYSSQMKEGMDYGELCKTITINIVNFRYLSHIHDYHSTFQLYEREQKLLLTDMLEIHFMELPKLLIKWRNREVDPREDQLVRWLLLLEASEDEEITQVLEEIAMQEDQVLKKAMDEWERVSQDPEVLLAYEARRKALLDEKSALRRAEKLGEEKGKQIGEEIGEKKGIIKVALSMIQKGLDNQTIAEFTNLTPEEIDKLRHQ